MPTELSGQEGSQAGDSWPQKPHNPKISEIANQLHQDKNELALFKSLWDKQQTMHENKSTALSGMCRATVFLAFC